jgi:hypothetical protein
MTLDNRTQSDIRSGYPQNDSHTGVPTCCVKYSYDWLRRGSDVARISGARIKWIRPLALEVTRQNKRNAYVQTRSHDSRSALGIYPPHGYLNLRSEGTPAHDPGMFSFTTNPAPQLKAPRAVTLFQRHRHAPAVPTVYSSVESEVRVIWALTDNSQRPRAVTPPRCVRAWERNIRLNVQDTTGIFWKPKISTPSTRTSSGPYPEPNESSLLVSLLIYSLFKIIFILRHLPICRLVYQVDYFLRVSWFK